MDISGCRPDAEKRIEIKTIHIIGQVSRRLIKHRQITEETMESETSTGKGSTNSCFLLVCLHLLHKPLLAIRHAGWLN